MVSSESAASSSSSGGGGGGWASCAGDEGDEPVAFWRLEPDRTFSDIKVLISSGGAGGGGKGKSTRDGGGGDKGSADNASASAVYHLHKNILAFGERKAEYFVGLLSQGGRYADAGELSINLESAAAARAFPALLDFLYVGRVLPEGEAVLSPGLFSGLLELSSYFGVASLIVRLKPYLMKDLSRNPSHLISYLPTIMKFCTTEDPRMESVYMLALHHGAHAILVRRDDELVAGIAEVADTKFITNILNFCHDISDSWNNRVVGDDTSYYFSSAEFNACTAIAVFYQKHKDRLSKADFEKITSKNLLPKVSHEHALQLLDMENDVNKKNVASQTTEISCLQKRCIDALCSDGNLDVGKRAEVFMRLPPGQVAVLLAHLSLPRVGNSVFPDSACRKRPPEDDNNGRSGIMVLSCEPAFRGCYRRLTESRQGRVWYGMSGIWEGAQGFFYFVPPVNTKSKRWIFIHFSESADIHEVVLYENEFANCKVPPAVGWKNSKCDIALPPILLKLAK